MIAIDEYNIDDETIAKVGLTIADNFMNAQIAQDSRVFNYPNLPDVFIMESDLYGNTMPKESCFLAFYGSHGLIGKHLKVDTLRTSTIDDIKKLVESNIEG